MYLVDNPPSEALVDWASQSVVDVRLPADRPWFQAPPPPADVAYWEYMCRCRREPVRVKRYVCEDGRGSVFLGQCRHCETLIWTYRCGSDPLDR
jgi:hypothetical protein